MTPGLAGFIASADDEHEWDEIVAGAQAALGAEFDVVPERGGKPAAAVRRTWLDTFDWRLHRAGLTLEYAGRPRGGGELLLSTTAATPATTPTADSPVTTQPVNGWQGARPHLMVELPDGPVASRIGDLVAPRALLPVVTVTSTTSTHRLLNEDGKTVARLLVERTSIPGPQARPLAPRLAITEVRGYQNAARAAARLLAAAPGIEPAATPTYADALRAVGRTAGDYSNKVDADITASLPGGRAAATVLLRLLDTVEANIAGVLADTDTEFLHDLRVSVRRTRSAMKLFGDALTGRNGLTEGEAAFFAAEFKWVGDLTTPTRDLDVHLLDFDDTAHSLTAAKPDDLEPFRSYLEQRRRREFRLLSRGLKSARFTGLIRDWRMKLTAIRGDSPSTTVSPARSRRERGAAGELAGTLAAERTRAAFTKTVRRGAAITPESPAETLHDLRKRAKELRYALEFFAPLHDKAAQSKVVGELKRLQDCLGEFQDTEVQVGEIRALATAMLAAGEAPAVTLLAMGEVTAGLALRQRAAREDFGRRFAAFAGIDGQRRISALLRGTRGGS
ncbi:MAG TPA: CHAD domain-containing protein [Trebonia sp.]|nr:CHAD domain-containing protein [Trebonia sp.]